MLTFYYARPSLYSRPVWLVLLEKKLQFELVRVRLEDGEQFEDQFRAINPFSHIPVLVDNGFRVIESSAILDYLETKYPTPALLPSDAESLATVRMVQSVALSELLPATAGLIIHHKNNQELEYSKYRVTHVLSFFEEILGDRHYFGGQNLTLAEIVAGTLVPTLPNLGISLTDYPRLSNWSERLLERNSWQQIQLSAEEFDNFKRRIRVLAKIWQKRRRQRMNAS